MCVNISITDDDKFEEDAEKFSVQITTTDSSVIVVPDSGNVEIRDDESKCWGWQKREGGNEKVVKGNNNIIQNKMEVFEGMKKMMEVI